MVSDEELSTIYKTGDIREEVKKDGKFAMIDVHTGLGFEH